MPIRQRQVLNSDCVFSDISRIVMSSHNPTSTASMKPLRQSRHPAPICILSPLSSPGKYQSAFCHSRLRAFLFFFQFWRVNPGLLPLLPPRYILSHYSFGCWVLFHCNRLLLASAFLSWGLDGKFPDFNCCEFSGCVHSHLSLCTQFIGREPSPHGIPTLGVRYMLKFLNKLCSVFPKWFYYSTSWLGVCVSSSWSKIQPLVWVAFI